MASLADILFVIQGALCLLPFMGWSLLLLLLARRRHRRGGVHRDVSLTAVYCMVARWWANDAGFGPDTLAKVYVGELGWHRPTVWAFRVVNSLRYRLFGRSADLGMAALHARTSFLDEIVERHAEEVEQIILLGAGFDTRFYRMKLPKALARFEVDSGPTQAAKRRYLDAAGVDTSDVCFVSVDFENESWLEQVEAAGFDRSKRTLFSFEGVIYYLEDEAVKRFFETIASCGEGNLLFFDFFLTTHVHFEEGKGADALMGDLGEPVKFGVEPGGAGALVAPYGMEVVDEVDEAAMIARFLPHREDGSVIFRDEVLSTNNAGMVLVRTRVSNEAP